MYGYGFGEKDDTDDVMIVGVSVEELQCGW
jgi:hypothetical protein